MICDGAGRETNQLSFIEANIRPKRLKKSLVILTLVRFHYTCGDRWPDKDLAQWRSGSPEQRGPDSYGFQDTFGIERN